jgi:hypothetical protein
VRAETQQSTRQKAKEKVTMDDRANELMQNFNYIDSIDVDWLGDLDRHEIIKPENLARLGRIVEEIEEIERIAKAEGFTDVIEQAASSREGLVACIPFRIGLDLIGKDPFDRDLALVRYEIALGIVATNKFDEDAVAAIARGKGFAAHDIIATPKGSPTPCFIGHATFSRDGVERAIDIPPVVVNWEDETDAPPAAPPIDNFSDADIAPQDSPF